MFIESTAVSQQVVIVAKHLRHVIKISNWLSKKIRYLKMEKMLLKECNERADEGVSLAPKALSKDCLWR